MSTHIHNASVFCDIDVWLASTVWLLFGTCPCIEKGSADLYSVWLFGSWVFNQTSLFVFAPVYVCVLTSFTVRPPIVLRWPAELSEAEPICSVAFHTPRRVHANTHDCHSSRWGPTRHAQTHTDAHRRWLEYGNNGWGLIPSNVRHV